MDEYEEIRRKYRPEKIAVLLIAESPPPPAKIGGSRHFYRTDRNRGSDDRLFLKTVQGKYPDAAAKSVDELENEKEQWLRRLQADGWYLIEALEESQKHQVKKPERQKKIKEALPRLIERVKELAGKETKIITIKSNVFDVAAPALRETGFTVLNEKNVDYPGVFNAEAYRTKLAALVTEHKL
jgi:hypothetical protein